LKQLCMVEGTTRQRRHQCSNCINCKVTGEGDYYVMECAWGQWVDENLEFLQYRELKDQPGRSRIFQRCRFKHAPYPCPTVGIRPEDWQWT
jgi:hypothetical protein